MSTLEAGLEDEGCTIRRGRELDYFATRLFYFARPSAKSKPRWTAINPPYYEIAPGRNNGTAI
jgi:hypothetical protein